MKIELKNLFEKLNEIKKNNKYDKLINNPEYVEVRNKIAEMNLNLVKARVLAICKSYDEDMIEAGNEGLLIAIERFDISMNTEFSTYAVLWIDQYIHREMSKTSNWGSIPLHKFHKIKKIVKNFEEKNGRSPSVEEISLETGIAKEEILHILNAIQIPASINYESEESDRELSEILASDEPSIEKQIEEKEIKEQVQKLLKDVLNPQQRLVVSLRFGIIDGKQHSLEDIARTLKLSRERIRQIVEVSLRKLYRSKEREKLIAYTDNPDDHINKSKKGC